MHVRACVCTSVRIRVCVCDVVVVVFGGGEKNAYEEGEQVFVAAG